MALDHLGLHPRILGCYLEGGLLLQIKDAVEGDLKNGLDKLRLQ